MTNRLWLVLVLLLASGGSQLVAAQDRTIEDLEPRVIGVAGTTAVGFSGYVDKFFSPDSSLPTNYTVQIQGAVSSRASLFIEGGFSRGLNKDDEDNCLSRFAGSIGIRLKL